MGGSGRWLKSLISPAKSRINDQGKDRDKSKKKWRLWKSSTEGFGPSIKNIKGHGPTSEKSESSFVLDEKFTAVMATVVRASPKDFMVIKKEWAAIRIQASFRKFLARRALRALRAVVRLQAIFRGRQVRKQAAVTLKCMQALVRVQARVRERNVMSAEERAAQKFLEDRWKEADPVKRAEQGWCDSPGTVDEVKAKLQMRQEAALKRERAMAYSLFHQHARLGASPKLRATRPLSPVKHTNLDNKSSEYSFLDRWMAAKPWDNRLMEDPCSEPPNMTPMSKKREDNVPPCHLYQERGSVRTRRTGMSRVTTSSSTKSLNTSQSTPSSSTVSSDFMCGDSPTSTSCTSKAKRGKESYFNKLYDFDRVI